MGRREPAGQARSDPAATTPAALETFGDFVDRWWPTWKTLHPQSATAKFYLLNQRILPTFGTRRLPRADTTALAAWADAIGGWKASLVAEGLRPHTINSYVAFLSTVINAAVDVELFDRNPIRRRSGSGRMPMLRNLEVEQMDVWLTIPQLKQLAGGTLNARNFQRLWVHALQQTGLDIEFGFKTVTRRFKRGGKLITGQVEVPKLTFHSLRHTHATHLIALGRPSNAVAARLGIEASPSR